MNKIMYRIRITVLKKAHYQDLIDKYENVLLEACPIKLGDVFIVENCEKPTKLCDSAWETLYPFIKGLSEGKEDYFDGWMKNKKSVLLSCNDGFRPVSFLVEVIE